jgi:hypothetical protein
MSQTYEPSSGHRIAGGIGTYRRASRRDGASSRGRFHHRSCQPFFSFLSASFFCQVHTRFDLRVIELGELPVLKRRDLIAMRFLVESRARDGSRMPGCTKSEGIGHGSVTNSRLSGSSALSTLLRRRAVGRRSRSHKRSRERPTSRGELPLNVKSAQGTFGRSDRHHHDRRQPRKKTRSGGQGKEKAASWTVNLLGRGKNAVNPNQPTALSQEFGPFYWLSPPPRLRPRRKPDHLTAYRFRVM